MNSTPNPVRDAIADEAAAWLHELSGPDAPATVRTGFMAWLRQSPQHVEEYLRIAGTDRLLRSGTIPATHDVAELIAAARHEPQVVALPTAHLQAPRRRRHVRALLAAAATLAGVVVLVPWLRPATQVATLTYATQPGERRTWQLADGSEVVLDAESAVSIHFEAGERRVDVDHGRVFFHVAKDPARRFRVTAGAASVIAVGTRFDVDRRGPAVIVRLAEGRVALYARGDTTTGAPASAAADLVLNPGEAATISVAGVSPPEPVAADEVEAWARGQLKFDSKSISEVTQEANRYLPIPVEIDDAGLGARRISGSLAMGDTDSLLAFLQSSADVIIERTPTRIRVHRRGHGKGTPEKARTSAGVQPS